MFTKGKLYRRKEIHDDYGGQRQNGISTISKHPMIFIFTGDSGKNHGYIDEWVSNDTFIYTGEGQIDDMQFTKGNKAIRDHIKNENLFIFLNT